MHCPETSTPLLAESKNRSKAVGDPACRMFSSLFLQLSHSEETFRTLINRLLSTMTRSCPPLNCSVVPVSRYNRRYCLEVLLPSDLDRESIARYAICTHPTSRPLLHLASQQLFRPNPCQSIRLDKLSLLFSLLPSPRLDLYLQHGPRIPSRSQHPHRAASPQRVSVTQSWRESCSLFSLHFLRRFFQRPLYHRHRQWRCQ